MTDNSKLGAALAHTINSASTGHWTSFELGGVLKAILAEFVVIPRADLPEVVERTDAFFVEGRRYDRGGPTSSDRRMTALDRLALAEYLEAQEHADACARAARRDELSREMCIKAYGVDATVGDYQNASGPLQSAIDRIIELEEAAR